MKLLYIWIEEFRGIKHQGSIPEEEINSVWNFLGNKLTASKNGRYRTHIASIRHLFEILYAADSSLFAAFYKFEVPLEAPYRSIVFALQDGFHFNGSGINWMYGTDIRFEWLSERNLTMLRYKHIYATQQTTLIMTLMIHIQIPTSENLLMK